MAKSGRIRLKDLRAAYRLVGECRERGDDPRAWRARMLDGLIGLTGSQLALYLQIHDLGTDAERIAQAQDAGFLDPSHRALWGRYQRERAHRTDPFHQRYYGDFTGALRTRRLDAVVDGPAWHRSPHYNDYVRACGLEDRITSSVRLSGEPSSSVQVIVLHRSAADGPFPRRAVQVVHLFHDELGRMIGRELASPAGEPEGAAAALPPRLQQVLDCLLRGDAEKQIAAVLGLSRHTVNRHVQRLYHRFDVHTRGELMFRCRDLRSPHR